jgi:tRNA (guanosine-2'-O-)-methyltransferase
MQKKGHGATSFHQNYAIHQRLQERPCIYPIKSYFGGNQTIIHMTPERQERIHRVLDKRQDGLTVVLENVFDPHNISAVMRTCDAVGVQDLYVLNTRIPLHKKWGAKSSSSAAEWLTIHSYADAAPCFAELRKRKYRILATHLEGDPLSLYDIDMTDRIALVFGNEHSGVSEEIRGLADGNFIIPQVGMIRSLNISVACAVSLYEAFRQKQAAGHYSQAGLSATTREELLKKWARGQLD